MVSPGMVIDGIEAKFLGKPTQRQVLKIHRLLGPTKVF
jgi:hypothetical protein